MTITKRDMEHAALTAQPGDKTLQAGAERLQRELQWMDAMELTPEECGKLIAGAVYEAMVSSIIGRGLSDMDHDFNNESSQ